MTVWSGRWEDILAALAGHYCEKRESGIEQHWGEEKMEERHERSCFSNG
jgi:hypothetical protein